MKRQGTPRSIDPLERFQAKYTVNADTGCWEWTASTDRKGYGQFTIVRTEKIGAHRASWILHRGPIPAGHQIDHLCRNHACVNPEHLEPVTPRENLMRGNTLASANAAKTHCSHGHEFTPENTLRKSGGRRACRECNRVDCKRRRLAKIGQ